MREAPRRNRHKETATDRRARVALPRLIHSLNPPPTHIGPRQTHDVVKDNQELPRKVRDAEALADSTIVEHARDRTEQRDDQIHDAKPTARVVEDEKGEDVGCNGLREHPGVGSSGRGAGGGGGG